jgi:hypothetical protein
MLHVVFFNVFFSFHFISEAVAGSKDGEEVPAGFSVFDALRDTIYSEVATLIANNENRPHFLVSWSMEFSGCVSLI